MNRPVVRYAIAAGLFWVAWGLIRG